VPRLSALLHHNFKNQKPLTMSQMQSSKLKWMDLDPQERYRMVGQVIDGMIYHSICVDEVKEMLSNWNDENLLKSIILPEPDNMCTSCNGTGEGSNPDTFCSICNGKGSKNIDNSFYNFYE